MNLNLSRILCVSSCSAATHISLNFVDWRLEMMKCDWPEIKVILMIGNQTFDFAWLNLWSTLLEHFILIDRQQRLSTCWYSKIENCPRSRQKTIFHTSYGILLTPCSLFAYPVDNRWYILFFESSKSHIWKEKLTTYSRNKMFQKS